MTKREKAKIEREAIAAMVYLKDAVNKMTSLGYFNPEITNNLIGAADKLGSIQKQCEVKGKKIMTLREKFLDNMGATLSKVSEVLSGKLWFALRKEGITNLEIDRELTKAINILKGIKKKVQEDEARELGQVASVENTHALLLEAGKTQTRLKIKHEEQVDSMAHYDKIGALLSIIYTAPDGESAGNLNSLKELIIAANGQVKI